MPQIPFCWVTRHDYADFRFVCVDGDKMPADYEAWLLDIGKLADALRAKGGVPVQINIKPLVFAEWCGERGISIDADARIKYAAFCHHTTGK